jgi:hypothetical protein
VCVELYQWLIELERTLILPSSLGLTLLLIEKATHDPLYLWDIKTFSGAVAGEQQRVGEYSYVHLFALSLNSFYLQF